MLHDLFIKIGINVEICIVDVLGLPFDGTTLTKRGLGGSESAIILMAKELVKLGFGVTVYNDCESNDCSPGVYDGVNYVPLEALNRFVNECDILIGSRSVAPFAGDLINHSKVQNLPDFSKIFDTAKKKILWMHDTFCDGDNIVEHLVDVGRIDELFTLSDFHTMYISNCDHGKKRNFEVLKNKIFQTRNGIVKHIDWVDISKKDKNLFVYNASVTKGMVPLVEKIWPEVKKRIPDAKLTVIGGFYRFKDGLPDEQEIKWKEMSVNLDALNQDVTFTGVIKQNEIAKILAEASYMIYPAAFPETFGISALESLAYNTPLITNRFGALEETAIDSACYKIPYAIEPNGLFPFINTDWQENAFINQVVDAYNNPYLHQQKMYACNAVKDICTWDTVALQWKQHFYDILSEYLPVEEYRKVSKINHKVAKTFGTRFSNGYQSYPKSNNELKMIVISPVYNGEKYIERCIKSVQAQEYKHYEHWIINDASTDNTAEILYPYLKDITVVNNQSRTGSALGNQISVLREHFKGNGGAVVVLLDGDDALANDPNIFNKLNDLYWNGAAFTYGSCYSMVDNIPLIAQEYPPEVKDLRAYRDYKFNWNMPYTHLRTFNRHLLDDHEVNAFADAGGAWLKAGGDTALFYYLIEKCQPHQVVCVPEILCYYNDASPDNDYKINGDEQSHNAKYILERKTPPVFYKQFVEPFEDKQFDLRKP